MLDNTARLLRNTFSIRQILLNVQGRFKDVFGENNQLIYTTGAGASRGFSCFISKNIPNLHFLDSGQGFYRYNNASSDGLF